MRRVGIEADGSIMKGRDADGIAQTEADHHMQCPELTRSADIKLNQRVLLRRPLNQLSI